MSEAVVLAEISIDLNAAMTVNGYYLEIRGAIDDLAKLGLTLEQAVGHRFLFNGGADTDDNGEPAEIVFTGIVVKDPKWGYLALCDPDGLHWRRIPRAQQADAADRPKKGAG